MNKRQNGVEKHNKPESVKRIAQECSEDNAQELVAAIRRGDGDVFAAFYLGYADSIIQLLTRIIGNKEDAEEVTQDAFAHIWENRETLSPQSTLVGYVAGTAKNMAFKLLRSKQSIVERQRDFSYLQDDLTDLADGELISRETELLINHTISRMSPQRRKVFIMSREEGLTYNEIAERLGLSYNTVRNHAALALEEIRSVLIAALVFAFMSPF